MGQIGNTFDQTKVKYGHARKVWREIRHVFPAGGTISNVSDFVSLGKVPSGTPVKYDAATKTITAYTVDKVKSEASIDTLGINGFLQEDAFVKDANTVASGTVVYAGEIYSYMIDNDALAKLQTLKSVPMIVFVQ